MHSVKLVIGLILRGADLVTLKEPLLDSAVSLTLRYAHATGDSKERAMQLLEENSDRVVRFDKRKCKKV